ncbi:galactokinase [Rhodococcus sp. NPDC058514]|uniref:galactokinase n=1 Tax=unclassified Rhodococcus (in: high G+C Gram-positive bacteria) TaxID=192944 RepID=UPI003657CD7B
MLDSALATDAIDRFRRNFGAEPEGVWAAPGRVNLIGEHVDYAQGLSLPIALPHSTVVAVGRRRDGVLRCRSGAGEGTWAGRIEEIAPGNPSGWAAYLAGVVWAMQREGLLGGGFGGVDVAVESSVPIGAGLSSSAALECALALALADLVGLPSDDAGRAALAGSCVRAENDIALAPTGGMDQAVSLRAKDGHALLVDSRDGGVAPVLFDLVGEGLALLVIDTRAPHRLVDGQYAQRRKSVEEAAATLGSSLRDVDDVAALTDPVLRRRAGHVVTEIGRVREVLSLMDSGRYRDLGPLLTVSHASLRDDYEVSCAELDCAVDAALAAGAYGARMTGGGFGGSAIALIDAGEEERVAAEVRGAARSRGLTEPRFLLLNACAGPARLVALMH